MKTFKSFLLVLLVLMLSCSKESLEFEPQTLEIEPTTEALNPTENEENEEVVPEVEKKSKICNDFDWTNITNNQIIIDCKINLNNQSINIPESTTVVYKGGEVKNGTLNFKDGLIDGELLNSTLKIEGNAKLTSDEFTFVPNRWDIVEGKVSDAVAKKNKDEFQKLIYKIKDLKGVFFKIDKFDAFFKVDVPLEQSTAREAAINIPGDFNLLMTDSTHLRMQPNGYHLPVLITVTNNSNVVIKGGNLHGERDQHDYSSGGTHEWPTLLSLASCYNITIDGVTMVDATGDGMAINANSHAHSVDYKPANKILVKNCKFIRNRRNNLSITDGHNIRIQENKFIDAGIHTNSSKGVAPGFAIDIEAARGNGPQPNQIVENVMIINNVERGSRVGGFTVHTGDRVTIDGNEMESSISYSTSIESTIRNNKIISTKESSSTNGTAITAGRNDRFEKNHGNKVYGNIITGYSTGIKIANTKMEINDNEIIDCKVGISLEVVTETQIYKNIINSNRKNSSGIVSAGLSEYLNNVIIRENNIDVRRSSFIFVDINNNDGHENYKLTILNNVSTSATFSNTNGIDFIGNTINKANLRLVNANNSDISSNIISAHNSNGIRLDGGCKNIKIRKNKISILNGNFKCIQQTTNDGINITVAFNNTCN